MKKAALTRFSGMAVALALMILGATARGPALAADAAKFDIYGVKLYMSDGEVLAALKQKFGDSVSPIITADPNGSLETMVVNDPTFSLKITLLERLPAVEASHYQVQSIHLKLMASSESFKRDFTRKLVAKYGKPQMGAAGTDVSWCVILTDRCYLRHPIMVYSGDALDLTDWDLQHRNDQYRARVADRAPPQP